MVRFSAAVAPLLPVMDVEIEAASFGPDGNLMFWSVEFVFVDVLFNEVAAVVIRLLWTDSIFLPTMVVSVFMGEGEAIVSGLTLTLALAKLVSSLNSVSSVDWDITEGTTAAEAEPVAGPYHPQPHATSSSIRLLSVRYIGKDPLF